MTRSEEFDSGQGHFKLGFVGRIRLGSQAHLVTGRTSTKCNPKAEVNTVTTHPHPGGELTNQRVGEQPSIQDEGQEYSLCRACFPGERYDS